MKRIWFAMLSLALLATSPAVAAEIDEGAMVRFVQAILKGQDLSRGEFSAAISKDQLKALGDLSACEPGQPRFGSEGKSVLILWDCPAPQGSASTLLDFAGGKLLSVSVPSTTIISTGAPR